MALRAGAACCAPPAGAQAATQVLVVAGLGGETQFDERFAQWSQTRWRRLGTATGDRPRVVRLAGRGSARAMPSAASMQRIARSAEAGDQFVLVLVGHGSFDGSEYRLNMPGPDITGTELLALLDKIPAGVPQLVVNGTSTSGAVAEQLGARRIAW